MSRAAGHGVHIAVHCEPGLTQVSADRVQIEQILLNLLRNAFHAVDGTERRRVWLTAERAGAGRVRLVVEDSREILENVARGGTNKVIAANLGISVRTVEIRILDERALRAMAGEVDRTAYPGGTGARGCGC